MRFMMLALWADANRHYIIYAFRRHWDDILMIFSYGHYTLWWIHWWVRGLYYGDRRGYWRDDTRAMACWCMLMRRFQPFSTTAHTSFGHAKHAASPRCFTVIRHDCYGMMMMILRILCFLSRHFYWKVPQARRDDIILLEGDCIDASTSQALICRRCDWCRYGHFMASRGSAWCSILSQAFAHHGHYGLLCHTILMCTRFIYRRWWHHFAASTYKRRERPPGFSAFTCLCDIQVFISLSRPRHVSEHDSISSAACISS